MGYNLFLDDNFLPTDIADLTDVEKDRKRYRTYRWTIVKTYEEFIDFITKNGAPDIVSFDHDLAPEHWDFIYNDENWAKIDDEIIINYDLFEIKTGYHAAEWLLEYCSSRQLKMPICLIHSQNKIGKKNIENILLF